jgi:hypothetical protein
MADHRRPIGNGATPGRLSLRDARTVGNCRAHRWHPTLASRHRRRGGSCYLPKTFITTEMGAEFLFGLATRKIPHMQRARERRVPVHRLHLRLRPRGGRAGCQACFRSGLHESAGPEAELLRPDPDNLTPTARALFEVLFPSPPATIPQPVAEGGA